ncbi:hypothetical protein POTOM_022315 [Populus tomentosa]|uniref:VQ domain-containing protein n=1 Tax=Populus tomentosa TaxID=118781 RepID=A0A8X7ZNB3_POPTO|nr:hypothetical protein POTOM_022315 [Populus tomentosa]
MFRDRAADSTTVTTTTINTSSVQNPMGSSNSSSSAGRHLSPEGRVAKPVRKRSRASRRTPTTLLNTDTTNFRAMVQQFTGGPSAPFASGSQINATNFGFALGAYRQAHHVNQPSPVMMPPAGDLETLDLPQAWKFLIKGLVQQKELSFLPWWLLLLGLHLPAPMRIEAILSYSEWDIKIKVRH